MNKTCCGDAGIPKRATASRPYTPSRQLDVNFYIGIIEHHTRGDLAVALPDQVGACRSRTAKPATEAESCPYEFLSGNVFMHSSLHTNS